MAIWCALSGRQSGKMHNTELNTLLRRRNLVKHHTSQGKTAANRIRARSRALSLSDFNLMRMRIMHLINGNICLIEPAYGKLLWKLNATPILLVIRYRSWMHSCCFWIVRKSNDAIDFRQKRFSNRKKCQKFIKRWNSGRLILILGCGEIEFNASVNPYLRSAHTRATLHCFHKFIFWTHRMHILLRSKRDIELQELVKSLKRHWPDQSGLMDCGSITVHN